MTAVPTSKTDLGFSQETLRWVVTPYAIFFGGVLLVSGRMEAEQAGASAVLFECLRQAPSLRRLSSWHGE